MINLKKIVAVALATTMCMGLSMTAFAVDRGSAVANLNNWNPDSPYYVPDANSGDKNGEGAPSPGPGEGAARRVREALRRSFAPAGGQRRISSTTGLSHWPWRSSMRPWSASWARAGSMGMRERSFRPWASAAAWVRPWPKRGISRPQSGQSR